MPLSVTVSRRYLFALFTVISTIKAAGSTIYNVDISPGLARRFDGVGGLSGGGATSKLLVNYDEPFRSEILDYLFKPNFGASLQILKVEIGGDGQSTDGTESSHMHEPWDENYSRGYEWWLMVEAKKRNPGIKLYALPWAWPGWLGDKSPYRDVSNTAMYITKWVLGAKKYYNLDIDYLGVWNEKSYNKSYVLVLRDTLDKNGLGHVQLVVADGGWEVSLDMLQDKTFAKAVDYVGAHYPGTYSTASANMTGKPLWSSEDYSTFNDAVGAGCWARLLNQNYVNGLMTSTISWNLIASYYQALPFGRDGLMTAQEPWSGHYVVQSPIWVSAHTTHFTSPGWHYLRHGSGVGKLENGGSYVSLYDSEKQQFTMVIETMSHDHSICIRPKLPAYNVSHQNARFQLKGQLASIKKLYLWMSKLHFDGTPDRMFMPGTPVPLVDGRFVLPLPADMLITLTTVHRDPPQLYPTPPASAPFPLPYMDDYESYPLNSEAYNFAPQVGVWEVREAGGKIGKVNRQVILNNPCYWCDTGPHPINIGGSYNWSDIYIQVNAMIPSVNGTDGMFVAARVSKGGCDVHDTTGVFLHFQAGSNQYSLTTDLQATKIVIMEPMRQTITYDTWYHLSLIVKGNKAYGFLDNDALCIIDLPSDIQVYGFVGYGASSYGIADFDNLNISAA